MTQQRGPVREQPLTEGTSETTSWELARERLADPEYQRTSWLATTRPDGRPHLIVGEGTRKGRNLAADGRCVVATSSTTLPSIDLVLEGRLEPITDADAVRDLAEVYTKSGWPLEAKGDKVDGPNAPTAGPPPYTIFRLVPSTAFGFPGMYGMDKAEGELPKPTRWEFDRA
jgi:hypothetical protein